MCWRQLIPHYREMLCPPPWREILHHGKQQALLLFPLFLSFFLSISASVSLFFLEPVVNHLSSGPGREARSSSIDRTGGPRKPAGTSQQRAWALWCPWTCQGARNKAPSVLPLACFLLSLAQARETKLIPPPYLPCAPSLSGPRVSLEEKILLTESLPGLTRTIKNKGRGLVRFILGAGGHAAVNPSHRAPVHSSPRDCKLINQ